jgi:hypothetical protein
MFVQRLLLPVALLATLVVLGCWDAKREIARVLEHGYETMGSITGAQYQRRMPLAVDGWRPRLVEQELSVDLKWLGKDGKEHEHKTVPVSESFARTVVSGDQVRLAAVALKVLDDEQSVPVIVTDASRRLATLNLWSTVAGNFAIAAWVGFAALTFWRRRRGAAAKPGERTFADFPPKRTMVGMGLLLAGALLAYQAWSGRQSSEVAEAGGTDVVADIVAVSPAGKGHSVILAWKDAQGAVHHFGPVPISEAFYGRITANGLLTVHQTQVRYSPGEPQKRPVILADNADGNWIVRFGLQGGVVLAIVGFACLFSSLRAKRGP